MPFNGEAVPRPPPDQGIHQQSRGFPLAVLVLQTEIERELIEQRRRSGSDRWLVVDRNPWALELYRLDGGLAEPERSTLADPRMLASQALPLTLQLQPGAKRPQIVVADSRDGRRWLA